MRRANFYFLLLATVLTMVCYGAEGVVIPPHIFTLPDGFEVEAVAVPPLVQRPIHMCFDEAGVMYVTDSSGNTEPAPRQLKDPSHRVLRLVDTNRDGVFDTSTVFAEKMPFPEGILWHEGAIYIGAPPHIWKLQDTDGDFIADERTIWFDGGTIEGCGNDLHGPYLGADGFFYWCKGAFQSQTHVLGNGKTFRSSAAHVYRARPDGSQLEVVITGGMNNPVGLAFDETGDRFLSGTFFDLSKPGRRDGILHAVYGGKYGKKNDRVLSPHPDTGSLLPVLTQMGPAAPSGIVMLRNRALGMQGDLFCADFNLRRISRHQLTRSGSTYRAETTSFLESDQTDFHPTDVIEDADGSMLVADTGSWYKICCPTSKVAKPEILGTIYRIRKKDQSPLNDPRGLELDWSRPKAEWLSDDRPAVVKRAITEFAEPDNIETLRRTEARLPAVWALHRIPGSDARGAVREFLSDSDANVRAAAIHSIGLWRDKEAVDPLIELLGGNDARQHRLAAMALGRLGDKKATLPLLEAGSKQMDEFSKHAFTYALYEIDDRENIPEAHPLSAQIREMNRVDEAQPSPWVMPEIELVDPPEADPKVEGLKKARLDELAAWLPKGDAGRGENLFNNAAKSLCLTCHVKGDRGGDFGPDLTSIGAIRSELDLLEAIVYPSATIARYFEQVTVRKKNGEVAAGILKRETTREMIIGAAPGTELAIPFREIDGAAYSHISLMPPVFDAMLSPLEIADLVAYLKEAEGLATSVGNQSSIPPHEPVEVPGLHAYAQKSISAGEEIEFRVSSTVPYRLSIVQLGEDPESRDQDPILKDFRVDDPESQPIHPGSYVHVDKALSPERRMKQLTLECWIRPFSLAGWQGLINQHDYPDSSGVGLFLNEDRIAFLTGSGGAYDPLSLQQSDRGSIKGRRWQHVAATWDGETKRIYIDGKLVSEGLFSGVVRPGKTALRLGSYGNEGVATNFYNGDLAMCVVHDRALNGKEIAARVSERGLSEPEGEAILGCWAFSEERGEKVADSGPDGRDGLIVNRGTWMIGGPGFDAAAVDRHDPTYDPTQDKARGHGLRLAGDELYNARWKVNHRFRIPVDTRSGVYAGRFDFEMDGKPMRYHTTFIVRKPKEHPEAPILVLVSSSTWLAYNSTPFPVNHGHGLINMGTGGLANSHPKAPRYSCYSDHHNGQPTYKIGLQVPWPAAGPNKTYIGDGYSHLLRGERFLHLWLDRNGYDYDVITDRDLDRDPDILNGYKTVVLNGHSEYWSVPAYEGLDQFLKAGGTTVVMSGNTMFWRVSFDGTGEVMECRKYGKGIGGRNLAKTGELYHSHDFKRGSLMRFCGYPAWKLVGLECIGWGGGNFGHYRVDQPDHFLFSQPHQVDLKQGEAFGFVNKTKGVVGHEYDVRLSTLLRATQDPAIKGLIEPKGITTLARSHDGRAILDFNAVAHRQRFGGEETIAEIIYWERPQGGRVFHTGSIATAWGLYHDETLSKLLKNVLHHFDVKPESP